MMMLRKMMIGSDVLYLNLVNLLGLMMNLLWLLLLLLLLRLLLLLWNWRMRSLMGLLLLLLLLLSLLMLLLLLLLLLKDDVVLGRRLNSFRRSGLRDEFLSGTDVPGPGFAECYETDFDVGIDLHESVVNFSLWTLEKSFGLRDHGNRALRIFDFLFALPRVVGGSGELKIVVDDFLFVRRQFGGQAGFLL